MKYISLIVLLLISTQIMSEQVYRCTTDTGKTIFSQLPCGEDAIAIEVDALPTGITPQESMELRNEHLEVLDEQSKRLERRRLETKLKNLEGYRNALSGKRDSSIAKLQKELGDARDFREKAVIESKMKEVRHQYREDRRRLDIKIYDARMDLERCCK